MPVLSLSIPTKHVTLATSTWCVCVYTKEANPEYNIV